MSATLTAEAVLERVYLEVRCRLLDVAASLDRIERADGGEAVLCDARWKQPQDGIAILASEGPDRAERIQMLFSDPYVANWNRRNGAKREERR
jgi:hypothetical protein